MITPDLPFWTQLFARLAVEAACVISAALLLDQIIRPAFWRRALWQSAVVCLLLMTVSELSGFGRGLASFLLGRARPEQKIVAWTNPMESVPVPMPQPFPQPSPLPAFTPVPITAPLTTVKSVIIRAVWWPGLLWLAGGLVILGRVAAAQILFISLRRRRPSFDNNDLNHRAAAILQRLSVRRKIRLLQSPGLTGPIAFGILRPSVGLPVDFAARFTRAEQDAMLAHELAHLAARDPLWYLLADLGSAALWWHPQAWWARRRLHRASELAADEAAAIFPEGPAALAECLVTLGRQMTQPPAGNSMGVEGGGFRSNLAERVQRLLRLADTAAQPAYGWRSHAARLAVILTLSTAAIALSGCLQNRNAEKQPTFQANLSQSWETSPAATIWYSAHPPKSPETPSAPKLVKVQLAKQEKFTTVAPSEIALTNLPARPAAAVADTSSPLAVRASSGNETIYGTTIRALEMRRIDALVDYNDHSNILSNLRKLGTNQLLPNAIVTVLRGQQDQELILRIERLASAQDALTAVTTEGFGPSSREVKKQEKLLNDATRAYNEKIQGIMNGLEALVEHDDAVLQIITTEEEKAKGQAGAEADLSGSSNETIFSTTARALEMRRVDALVDYNDHSNILSNLKKLGTNQLLPNAIVTVLRGQKDQELILRIERLASAQDALTAVMKEGFGPSSKEVKTQENLLDDAIRAYNEKLQGIMNGLESLVEHDKVVLQIITTEKNAQGPAKEKIDQPAPQSALPYEEQIPASVSAASKNQPQTSQLYTRTFHIDPKTFLGWESAGEVLDHGRNEQEAATNHNAAPAFFKSIGLDLSTNNGKFIYLNERSGDLLVRATEQELDAVAMVIVVFDKSPLIHTSAGRQEIMRKLLRIKISEMNYPGLDQGLPLTELMKALTEYTKKRDIDQQGIRFAYNPHAGGDFSGGAAGAATPTAIDPKDITIRINPPLKNLTLFQALDAICKLAKMPEGSTGVPTLTYTIEDYAVYFFIKPLWSPPLYTRTFHVDPNAFLQEIHGVTNQIAPGQTGASRSGIGGGGFDGDNGFGSGHFQGLRAEIIPIPPAWGDGGADARHGLPWVTSPANTSTNHNLVLNYFRSLGIDLGTNNGRFVFFNDRTGDLLIRATEEDLNTVARFIDLLNQVPPLSLQLDVKFASVTQQGTNGLGFNWFLGDLANTSPLLSRKVPTNLRNTFPTNAASMTNAPVMVGILSDQQFRVVINDLDQRDGTDLLSAPRATTLSGRQAHLAVQDIVDIVTSRAANTAGSAASSQTNDPFTAGPTLDVLPTISADGYSIQMVLIPTYTEFVGYENPGTFTPHPHPLYRLRQSVTSVNIWDGQTIVLSGKIASATNSQQNLVIFITARIIDSSNNPVHTDEEMPFAKDSILPQPPEPGGAK